MHSLLAPLIIEGDQEGVTDLLNASAEGSSLGGTPAIWVTTLQLPEDLCGGEFWPLLEPAGDLIPDSLKGIFAGAPVMRPPTFLIPSFPLLLEQRWGSMWESVSRQLLLRNALYGKPEGGTRRLTGRGGFWRDCMPPQRLLEMFELREQAQRLHPLGNAKQLALLCERQGNRSTPSFN